MAGCRRSPSLKGTIADIHDDVYNSSVAARGRTINLLVVLDQTDNAAARSEFSRPSLADCLASHIVAWEGAFLSGDRFSRHLRRR